MSNTFQLAPGRIKFDSVFIGKQNTNADITSLVAEVNIYSSITDITSVANFLIIDAKSLLTKLPIETGDRITLAISYPDVQQTHTFIISKIESIENHEKQISYSIKGVSQLFYNSMFTTISRSFSGTTAEIAQNIFLANTKEKFGLWEKSLGMQTLVVPNWSPIKTIHWLAKRSTGSLDNTRFLFFQDSLQKYHFTPVEKFGDLYKKQPTIKYTYRKNNELKGEQNSTPNSAAAMETILSIEYHDYLDAELQAMTGKFGGTRFTTDISTKTLDIITYDYWKDFKQSKSLNGYPVWRKTAIPRGYNQYDTLMTNSQTNIEKNKVSDLSNIKVSTLDKGQYITIVVHGNQVVELGQVIEIVIPSAEPKSQSMKDQFDQRWSGKYYVVAKRDMFNKEKKQTALTLAKESLLQPEVL